jgi:hypothetical protein
MLTVLTEVFRQKPNSICKDNFATAWISFVNFATTLRCTKIAYELGDWSLVIDN